VAGEGVTDTVHLLADPLQQLRQGLQQFLFQNPGNIQVEFIEPRRDLPGDRRGEQRQQTALLFPRVLQFCQQFQDPLPGHLAGKVARGHILQMMAFINNQPLKWREDCRPGKTGLLAQGQVSHQQGVVHHQQVGAGGIAAGSIEMALGVETALHPTALVTLAAELLPDFIPRDEAQVVTTAAGGGFAPRHDRLQFRHFFRKESRLILVTVQLAQAEIVAPALDQHRPELDAGVLLQKGDVLAGQLFLQIDGIGGDDHPFLVPFRPECRREQIGQGFAGAGAGLDHGHPVAVEGFGNGKGHAGLLFPLFITGKVGSHHPARGKIGFDLPEGEILQFFPDKGGYGLVALFQTVIDDVEADPLVAEDGGDFQVGAGRGKVAGGVIVDDHITVGGGNHDGRHRVLVPPCQRFYFDDKLRLVGRAEKKDLVATATGDLPAHLVCCIFRYQAFHGGEDTLFPWRGAN